MATSAAAAAGDVGADPLADLAHAVNAPRPLPSESCDGEEAQPEASTSAPAAASQDYRRHRAARAGGTAAAKAGRTGGAAGRPRRQDSGAQAGAAVRGEANSSAPEGTRPSSAAAAARPSPRGTTPASARPGAPYPRSAAAPTPPPFRPPHRQSAPPRPRLRPPPPPQSWPDYPYTRRPAASACDPSDLLALKLEALFQCVLHYPRVPPKLLRFMQRAKPWDAAAVLASITATVEALSEELGREMAVYLIRRRPWVVTVRAEAIGPRMEAARRLLGLPASGVLDLLRKNPNLLRLDPGALRERYEALHPATGFSRDQVRALVLKFPLILNFHAGTIASAATALRRLCSARPSWAACHAALTPSQFAYFMRDRVNTLLRIEYLLLTGGGQSLTLRDVIKMSNNVFKKSHSSFRFWMMERLRRLRERLLRAREAAYLEAAAAGEAAGGRGVSEPSAAHALAAEVARRPEAASSGGVLPARAPRDQPPPPPQEPPSSAQQPPQPLSPSPPQPPALPVEALEALDQRVEASVMEEERRRFVQGYVQRRRADAVEAAEREAQRQSAIELKLQQEQQREREEQEREQREREEQQRREERAARRQRQGRGQQQGQGPQALHGSSSVPHRRWVDSAGGMERVEPQASTEWSQQQQQQQLRRPMGDSGHPACGAWPASGSSGGSIGLECTAAGGEARSVEERAPHQDPPALVDAWRRPVRQISMPPSSAEPTQRPSVPHGGHRLGPSQQEQQAVGQREWPQERSDPAQRQQQASQQQRWQQRWEPDLGARSWQHSGGGQDGAPCGEAPGPRASPTAQATG